MKVLPAAIWSNPLDDRSAESVKGYSIHVDGEELTVGARCRETWRRFCLGGLRPVFVFLGSARHLIESLRVGT